MSRRRKRKKRINMPKLIWAAFCLGFISFACVTLVNQQIKIADKNHLLYETNREIAAVIQETDLLEEELLHVEEDWYLEQAARRHGFVKPNERIFIDASTNRVR